MSALHGLVVGQAVQVSQDSLDQAMVETINGVFMKHAPNGAITYDELKTIIRCSPEMRHFFNSINVDASEARRIFLLLDYDNDGQIDYDEFVHGALRLRGNSKALDLALLAKESNHVNEWVARRFQKLDQSLKWICDKLMYEHKRSSARESGNEEL